MTRRPIHQDQRPGGAVVELAVVAPILFMLIFGIIEFGRAFMVAEIVVNASREGARHAVAQGAGTVGDVKAYTRTYLNSTGIGTGTANDPTVPVLAVSTVAANGTATPLADTTNMNSVASGTPVMVRIEVDFSRVSWLPSTFFMGSGKRLAGTTVMRKE